MGSQLIPLVTRAKSVFHIDHHASGASHVEACRAAFPDVNRYEAVFDTEKSDSAASLTWRCLHDETIPVHPFVRCVQIGDTWNWDQIPSWDAKAMLQALKNRKAFSSFPAMARIMAEWDAAGSQPFAESLMEEGRALLAYETLL